MIEDVGLYFVEFFNSADLDIYDIKSLDKRDSGIDKHLHYFIWSLNIWHGLHVWIRSIGIYVIFCELFMVSMKIEYSVTQPNVTTESMYRNIQAVY